MRLGAIELAIIIGITILIVVLTRIGQFKKATHAESQESPEVAKRRQRIFRNLKRAGVVLAIIGILLLFAGIGVFKWALSACAWSLAMVAIGLVLVLIFGRR